jgi:hypothetical protein
VSVQAKAGMFTSMGTWAATTRTILGGSTLVVGDRLAGHGPLVLVRMGLEISS